MKIKSIHKYSVGNIYNMKVKDLRLGNKAEEGKDYKVLACTPSTSAFLDDCYELTIKEVKK